MALSADTEARSTATEVVPARTAPRLQQGRVALLVIVVALVLIGGVADAVSQVAANNEKAPTPLIVQRGDWQAHLRDAVVTQLTSRAAVSQFHGWAHLKFAAVSVSLLDTSVTTPNSYSDAAVFNLLVRIFAAMHTEQPRAAINIVVNYPDASPRTASLQFYATGYFSVVSGPYSFTGNLTAQPALGPTIERYWIGATLPRVDAHAKLPDPTTAA